MEFQIRRAEKRDCPAMLDLIHELALYEKAPDEVTVDPLHFEESGFGEKPVWWAFVVENEEKKVIAFALYYIRYSTWKGQVMYLEDILVTEALRGNGIGKMLIERLIDEASEKGFKRMTWQVLDWNAPAINFYKKFGAKFDPEWVNVTIEIPQN